MDWINVNRITPKPFVSVLCRMPGEKPFPNDHYNRDICTGCEYNNDNNWQWRGVQEENNG